MDIKRILKEYIDGIYKGTFFQKNEKSIKADILDSLYNNYLHYIETGLEQGEALGKVFQQYPNQKSFNEHFSINLDEYHHLAMDEAKALIKKSRWVAAGIAIFTYMFLAQLLSYLSDLSLFKFLLLCITLILLCLIIFRNRKLLTRQGSLFLNNDTLRYFEKYVNIYRRKSIVAFGLLAYSFYIFSYLLTTLAGQMDNVKLYQLIGLSNMWDVQLILAILINNLIKLFITSRFSSEEGRLLYKGYFKNVLIFSVIYWIASMKINALALSQGYGNIILVLYNSYLFLYVCIVLINRKKYLTVITPINKVKKSLVCVICALLLLFNIFYRDSWAIGPYISTIPTLNHDLSNISYDKDSGVYSITMDEDFKILQLTDIHLGGSVLTYNKDKKALEAVYELINYTEPDFIIVTGDFVFPVGLFSFSFNNYTPMLQFASFMRNIGIPWALTYGNHDTEFVASHTADELNSMLGKYSYESSGSNLLYTDIQPNITGRSNQYIKLLNEDGSINQTVFLLDSNDYTGNELNDYDYIHQDQIQWYKQSVEAINEEYDKLVPSLMFFHIPIEEYKYAYELYKDNNPSVKYYFGEVGEANEAICSSKYETSLFETMVDLGSTKGTFCGHDHYNNISLEYQGIRLTYGMSIDYLAMPGIYNRTKQRGGTVISINKDSSFDIKQVPLDSINSQ